MARKTAAPADLLDAIRADPDDDAPRLAYADWLDANGQPGRAEYVRLAVESDRLPTSHLPRCAPLRLRLNELQRAHHKEWLAERPELGGVRWALSRGLVEHAWFDSYTSFHKHHEAVLRQPVTRVGFSTLRAARRLFDSPALARVRELDFRSCGGFDAQAVGLLAASPHVAGLRYLSLPSSAVTDATLTELAGCARLSGLRTLLLGGYYGIGVPLADGFAALASSPHLTGLRRLDVARLRPGLAGIRALLESDQFASLTWLDLGECHVGPAGLESLEDGSRLAALTYLRLNGNGLGDDGARLLADARRLDKLETLLLYNNLIGNEGARHLARAKHFGSLRSLSLGVNAVGGPGLAALSEAKQFAHLEGLELSSNLVGDDGLMALGRSKHFPRLRLVEANNVPARREVVMAVLERYRSGKRPLKDAPPAPAPVVAARSAAPVGHADEDGLLEAIIAAPEDDLPRMVYADWLEEHGEADRASLLRQNDRPDAELEKRALPAIPREFAGTVHRLQFERGLLTMRVQMRGLLTKAFQAAGPAWVRGLRLFKLIVYGMTKDWNKVASMPLLSQVRTLQVDHGSLKREGLAALVSSPHLGRLFGLDLSGNQLNYGGRLKALFGAGTLPNLCNLRLTDNYIGQDTVRELAAWRPARRLTALSLANNCIGAGGVALLATSEFCTEMTQLDLSSNSLPDHAVHALIESPTLGKLTHLWLRGNGLTDAGVRALAASPFLRRLQRLDLGYNRFGGDAALALARSPHLGAGCRLHLWTRAFTPGTVAQLREALGARLVG